MSKVDGRFSLVILGLALSLMFAEVGRAAEPEAPGIINGSPSSEFPGVGQLLEYLAPELPASDGLGTCTVTLVGCSTAVTAAHCVCDPINRIANGADCQPGEIDAPDASEFGAFFSNLGIRVISSIEVHPDYDPADNFDADVAVLRLGVPVDGIRPMPLASGAAPAVGTAGEIVGFGVGGAGTALGRPGIKRSGDVEVAACAFTTDTQICTDFAEPLGQPGDNSAPCDADSGAPLLVESGGTLEVAGIASFHADDAGDCAPPSQSHYAATASVASFLAAASAADLSTAACGPFLQAGESGAQSNYWLSNLVDLGQGSFDSEEHSFVVPAGASRLMVTLNGEQAVYLDNGSDLRFTDFDLEVWRDADPNTIICSSEGDSVVESCDEIFAPQPGSWTARATRYSFVGGEYQLVANYLLPDGTEPPQGNPLLVSSILPTSRSVQVGDGATAFATILNAGDGAGQSCTLTLGSEIPATLTSWQTDPATNAIISEANPAIEIPAGGASTWVFRIVADEPVAPTEVELIFDCENSLAATIYPGINTLLLSASAAPVPDVVALALTGSGNGILEIAGSSAASAFVTASINLGSASPMNVTARASSANLPLNVVICESNPLTAVCLSPPGSVASLTMGAGATPTFSIFVTARGSVPLDAAQNRIYVEFRDADGVLRGSSSVAVSTNG
ncbi:MAG: trypsin-like serine protease [Candidatus Binatia bacterium]|nr:trypsin-like serine protease [Candidatus Binatia bacterium]MDG2009705.1 trypsin-like serine protease [Candidatus Binatia bacterium]